MGPKLISTEQQVGFWRSIPGILGAEQPGRGNWFLLCKKKWLQIKRTVFARMDTPKHAETLCDT